MSNRDHGNSSSNEGAPGLATLVLIGVLFVAALVSTWSVYTHAPVSTPFGFSGSAPMPPTGLGYSRAPVLGSFPTPTGAGASGAPIADVELAIQWTAWDWNTASLVGTTVQATLQRAAPGGTLLDSETTTLTTTPGAVDERFWARAFEGPFESLTSDERAAIADDLATALTPFLATPGFAGVARIELGFVVPGGSPERFEVARDPADSSVLVARLLP
jgi:hypothetical protein